MIFCARRGDEDAISAILRLCMGAHSEMQVVCDALAPAGSVFVYTDPDAAIKNNLRVLRRPNEDTDSDDWKVRRARNERARFVEPPCASTAAVVVAIRPYAKIRSPESMRCALECLFEELTGLPFDPVARETARARRRAQHDARLRTRSAKFRDSCNC